MIQLRQIKPARVAFGRIVIHPHLLTYLLKTGLVSVRVFVFLDTESYCTNPQFHVHIPAGNVDSEGLTTAILGLRLQPACRLRSRDHQRTSVGYDVYTVSQSALAQSNLSSVLSRVVPDFGSSSGKSRIRQFFRKSSQIQLQPNLLAGFVGFGRCQCSCSTFS